MALVKFKSVRLKPLAMSKDLIRPQQAGESSLLPLRIHPLFIGINNSREKINWSSRLKVDLVEIIRLEEEILEN